ncbi:MAG: hypothetical protein Kow00129_03130 [Thermoleophilia bacterium]
MSWLAFRWTWELAAPLFVGTSPAGALNRCRMYVPARAVWGAVTAELARHEQGDGEGAPRRYEEVGSDLTTNFRFTYLYPAEQVRGNWQAWLPTYSAGRGLNWEREDEAEAAIAVADRAFRRRILHTRPSTAIDPRSDTAADGSLRETECLQPHWRDAAGRDAGPVALVGYVFARQADVNPSGVIERLAPIRSLLVGGDTRYGLGRLDRLSCDPANRLFGRTVELSGDEPVVRSATTLAHTSAQGAMTGALEALGGWDIGRQKPLGSDGAPLWAPGSKAPNGAASFRIDEQGIWRLEDEGTLQATTNEGISR